MSKITILEFAELVKENLSQLLSNSCPDLKLDIKQFPHPGGILLIGLTIQSPSSSIAPILYLDDLYNDYCSGTGINSILNNLIQTYEKYSQDSPQIDTLKLADWNFSKSLIVGRFINIGNQPGDRYLTIRPVTEIVGTNIGIIYDIDLSEIIGQNSSVPVNFSILENWNITIQELNTAAKENLPRIRPFSITSMDNLVKTCLDSIMDDPDVPANNKKELIESINTQNFSEVPMYIVSNTQQYNGTISITYPGIYEKICEMLGGNFYILPCSVHECICVPQSCASPKDLLSMVTEINHSTVKTEDFLCDDIFEIQNGQLTPVLPPDERRQAIQNGMKMLPFY